MEESKFHITFTIDQEKEIKDFFLTNGYVAIRDVLTEAQCNDTVEDINKQMKETNPLFDINNVSTYEHAPIINNFGMHAKRPIFTKQFLENRQNEKIYKAFSLLYGDGDILMNHDRCAFYRPTRGLLIDNKVVDKPEWKTSYIWPNLHLDMHPSSYFRYGDLIKKREMFTYSTTDDFVAENNLYCEPDGLQIQGVINLLDNYEEDGGFQCVPGFPSHYKQWCQDKQNFENTYEEGVYHFSKNDKVDNKYIKNPIRIPVPKGTIILWTQLMSHGSKPNDSNRGRMIQFIKAYPKKIFSKERLKKRSICLKKKFNQIKFTPSKIGRIVFGM
ncbi:MAG: WD repeat protein [Edafosvirus sp.]|uniref:WD repeat protein n=1 Tax=Edafosvirus sp. TaxID=2487765 RepID=A0A3G4ZW66_9VIRU|nr:MAG: WD repeat protein [Edafosvirus sp.]